MEWFGRLMGVLVPVLLTVLLVGWRYDFGPVLWIKRARGRKKAETDDSSRRELVERVRQSLPQAKDGSVVFSLEVESSTSGGSKVRVTTYTYYYKVFVAEGDCLWIVPFSYDKGARTYRLGDPVPLTKELVRTVELSGKRDKKLTVTFYLNEGVGLDKVAMVLEPLQFRKNKFYPFNFLQKDACDKALAVAEKLAYAACGMTAEDLERTRIKDECTNYAVGAGFCGFFGIVAASVGSLPLTIALFAAAVVLFGVMLAKKEIPKFSVVVVIVEAVISYFILR